MSKASKRFTDICEIAFYALTLALIIGVAIALLL